MLQHNRNNTTFGLKTQKNGTPHEDCDALLRAKDRTISELREQVNLLRRELKRRDAIPACTGEGTGELLPAHTSGVSDAPRPITSGETRDDEHRHEKPVLPSGYRVVAIASDAWVLVATGGLRVAVYRGELDLRKVALDAREHHQWCPDKEVIRERRLV